MNFPYFVYLRTRKESFSNLVLYVIRYLVESFLFYLNIFHIYKKITWGFSLQVQVGNG